MVDRQTIVQWKGLGIRAADAHELECFAFVARAENRLERAARLFGADSERETTEMDRAVARLQRFQGDTEK